MKMKLAYDCLPGIPSALRNTWKVPVQKAIKAESSPPELEGDIHPSSTASTIPAATTEEQKLLEMKKKIEEVSERVESLSYSPTPWLAQGFRRGLYKASAGPSTPVQPDDEMDSDDALKILPGYRFYRAPRRPLKPQPHMHVLEKELEGKKRRNPIPSTCRISRSRREKFQDLRAKAHEERMKSGSSSHFPPQDAVVRTQWSSEKEQICDGSLADIDDSDLIEYEDERSSNEGDPLFVNRLGGYFGC
ncbi:hypothetical protein BJ165DRAFT_923601 [Panaeolus papilionaceus]|nr:hypothetical protein BJ165DRAFT_923601 [Panaeolus papilionaceus]